ncbi:MAG TPA: DUF2752 domain-containing protein, partial [Candidatus Dormibacteraeota bacterium]|nr:DUF2752 domain-containing protein [Candidatus Dormibacteraeota bacterium]
GSALPLVVTRAMPADRRRDLLVAFALVVWLVYTRVYWVLHALHLGAPVCPFYFLTGHPCPFCGGTRSFAYMWGGDLSDAVRLYPLGPALFAGTFGAIGGLVAGAVSGRSLRPRLTPAQWRGVLLGTVVTVLISWALKVFVLGN